MILVSWFCTIDLERSAPSSSSWFQTTARFSAFACLTAEIEMLTCSGFEKWSGVSPAMSSTPASAWSTPFATSRIFVKRLSGCSSSRRVLTTSSIFSVASIDSDFIHSTPFVIQHSRRPHPAWGATRALFQKCPRLQCQETPRQHPTTWSSAASAHRSRRWKVP